MSSTLIVSVKSVFTETLTAKFSVLLGEPEVNIHKAIHGAIPMALTDIFHKAWSQEHTVRVWNLAKQAAAGDFFGRMHELTNDSGGLVTGSVLLNRGTDFAKSLLSPRTEAVINAISRYASISIPASSFITGVVSFAALDAIGRHIANTNADASNLAIWIGGYSDNTGDSVNNIRLSRQRAEKIETKLKDLGARPAQLTGAQGYGTQYPVGDNGTAAGRAMNRRMSIDVKAK